MAEPGKIRGVGAHAAVLGESSGLEKSMSLGITGKAARLVIDLTRERIAELGPDHVPAIAWITGDTDPQGRVPRLAVGIAEKEQVKGRSLECEEFHCEIAHALPDEILREYELYEIDVGEEGLVFARK
jgi:hypothetical protein